MKPTEDDVLNKPTNHPGILREPRLTSPSLGQELRPGRATTKRGLNAFPLPIFQGPIKPVENLSE